MQPITHGVVIYKLKLEPVSIYWAHYEHQGTTESIPTEIPHESHQSVLKWRIDYSAYHRNDWYSADGVAFVFFMLCPVCEILCLHCISSPVTRCKRSTALTVNVVILTMVANVIRYTSYFGFDHFGNWWPLLHLQVFPNDFINVNLVITKTLWINH